VADYTRLIELKVNDRQIKQATDRLFKSLDRIEKKLDVIAGKGFDGVGASANKASKNVGKLDAAFTKASQKTRDFILKTGLLTSGLVASASYLEASARKAKFFADQLAYFPGLVTKASGALNTFAASHIGLTAAVGGGVAAYTLLGSSINKLIPQTFKLGKAFRQFTDSIPGKIAEVSGAFDKLNQKIDYTTSGLIELAKGEGLKGLKSLMSTAVLEQEKLLSSNSLYLAQVIKVREVESAVNQELIARQRILDGIVQKEGITAGPGLSGLQKTLREQEAILNRMLTTEEGFSAQVAKVKSIEELINEELKERDRLMGKINIKEEKSVSLLQRARNAASGAGAAAQKFRPGGRGFGVTGFERRGLQVGAAAAGTMGVSGYFAAQNSIAAQVNKLSSIPMPFNLPDLNTGIEMATQSANGFLGVLNQIGQQLGHVQPEYLAIAAAAYMAFGGDIRKTVENVFKAGKETRKTTASLINFGKAALDTGRFLKGINMDFKLTSAGAKQLGVDIDTVANDMDRMTRKRALAAATLQKGVSIGSGNIQPSGFGAWSAAVDKKAAQDNVLKQRQLVRLGYQREVQRTRGLSIDERINRVLAQRGKIMTANGKIEDIQNKKKGLFQGGARGAVSSAMIGGGFPLLFGQGGASAIGGGIGGALGGAIGGGFGFAASVVGTAAGQWVENADKFNREIARANGSMSRIGDGAGFSAKQIEKMAKHMKITKEEALTVATTFKRFGAENAELFGQFFGGDASGLMAVGRIQDQASALEAINVLSKDLSFQEQERLIAALETTSAAEMQVKLQGLLLEIQFEENKSLIKQVGLKEKIWYWTKRTFALLMADDAGSQKALAGESPAERVTRELKELEEAYARIESRIGGLLANIGAVDKASKRATETIPGKIEEIERNLKKLTSKTHQIISAAQAIGSAFKDSFKGIIDGSMSAGEAFAAFTRKIANSFLDMAAEMAAQQLTLSILKMFAGSTFTSTGQIGSTGMQGSTLGSSYQSTTNPALNSFDTGGLGLAEGGYVGSPTNALIGEGGEGEYVIPESKMTDAMARYAGGARGDAVLAGGGGDGEAGGISGGVSGSIDVTFNTQVINDVSYVSYSEFQAGVQQAAIEGARRGEQATLRKLQTSQSTRRRIGV